MKKRILLGLIGAAVVLAIVGAAVSHAGLGGRTRAAIEAKGIRGTQGIVAGTVTDADTGEPVEGAYISFGGSTRSDANGRYAFQADLLERMVKAAREQDSSLGEDYVHWPTDKAKALLAGKFPAVLAFRVMANGYDPLDATATAEMGTTVAKDIQLRKSVTVALSDEALWGLASKGAKVRLKRPEFMPPGFSPAPLFDGGERGSPFAGSNPRVSNDGSAVVVQYNNGATSIFIHCGTSGDVGEGPATFFDVAGTRGSLTGGPGNLLAIWTEARGGKSVQYAVQAIGDPGIATTETVLAIARSCRDW